MSNNYWFPRKRFGWGPPQHLPGWVFLIGWIALLVTGVRNLQGLSGVIFFAGMIGLLAMIVCFRGEPPEHKVP